MPPGEAQTNKTQGARAESACPSVPALLTATPPSRLLLLRRRSHVKEAYQPWWPASIDSPTHYFYLKRRALHHQFAEHAHARSVGWWVGRSVGWLVGSSQQLH